MIVNILWRFRSYEIDVHVWILFHPLLLQFVQFQLAAGILLPPLSSSVQTSTYMLRSHCFCLWFCPSMPAYQVSLLGCIICLHLVPSYIHSPYPRPTFSFCVSCLDWLNPSVMHSDLQSSLGLGAWAQEPSQLRHVRALLDCHWCLMLQSMCLITLGK